MSWIWKDRCPGSFKEMRSFSCCVFVYLVVVRAQSESNTAGYCTRELEGTLESRVARADVVITGTVIRVANEHLAPWDFVDKGWTERLSNTASTPPGSQYVGFVKLWRVVKGSLAHVANHTSGPQELLAYEDSSSNSVLGTPVIKLYGVRNDKLCGSFVTQGDTRIFFLKKYPDFRNTEANLEISSPERIVSEISPSLDTDEEASNTQTRPERLDTSFESTANASKPVHSPMEAQLNSSAAQQIVALADKRSHVTESFSLGADSAPSKKKKSGKGKKNNRRKKNREQGKKRKRKNKSVPKSEKKKIKRGRKSAGRKKKRATESLQSEWKRLIERPKRNVQLENQMVKTNVPRLRARRDLGNVEPRSVLVLYSPPARITLANLNGVEDMVNAP